MSLSLQFALTATALLVAAASVARVTTLCGFVIVGDGCVGCHHLNLLSLLAQCKLLAEGLARRPEGESQLHADCGTKHPIKAVGSQVAFLGTGADGNAWVSCVGCCRLAAPSVQYDLLIQLRQQIIFHCLLRL